MKPVAIQLFSLRDEMQKDVKATLKKVKELGYDGAITIEREISGDQQIKDILMAKNMLEELIAK